VLARALRGIALGAAVVLVAIAGPTLYPVGLAVEIAAAQPGRDGPLLQHVPFPTPTPPPPVFAAPSRLQIPSLALDAPVEALGVDATGAMETPHNLWDVGWFRRGPSPGELGDAVIDGHVGLPGYPLIFSSLARITIGADLIVVHADGTRSHFTVTGVSSTPADSHPTGLFATSGPARLTLITCTGSYDGRNQTYANRLLVDATFAGSG
jgi:sortase (surface protein transpeptidase)